VAESTDGRGSANARWQGEYDRAGSARLNSKPDLSGIWQVQAEPRAPGGLFGLGESPNSKYFRDILADFAPDQRPLTPAGAKSCASTARWELQSSC
jgi:hypothetical protein